MNPEDAQRGARAAIDGYLASSVALLGKPTDPLDPVAVYAAGEALSEIENQAQQFDAEGTRLSGASRIDGASVTASDLAANPATVTITACVDDTGITVYTPDQPNGVKGTQRSRTIFVVAYADQQWKVVSRSFADDAAC